MLRASFPNDENGKVLVEGFLGKIENMQLTEGIMLEIDGANGSLRMDFSEQELKKLLANPTHSLRVSKRPIELKRG